MTSIKSLISRIRLGPKVAAAAGEQLRLRARSLRFSRRAERLLDPFRGQVAPSMHDYHGLVRYFAESWKTYRTASGAGAEFPGLPSWSGPDADRLEGFARLMPLLAAWCASGRNPELELVSGGTLNLPEEFARGLIAGTDPASPSYWGAMPGRSNQRIVEAADVALALWLLRDSTWNDLPASRQAVVVEWLAQVGDAPGLENNWQLFFVLIDRILDSLGHPGRVRNPRERFAKIRSFHLGDGWFQDGPEGRVDFYNAWGFHYALNWIQRIDPEWDPDFILGCQRAFLSSYACLISPRGIPLLGRSFPYRIAVPAPLVAGQERHPDLVSAGEARRALDVVWGYFIANGAVRGGLITQGYHGADPRLLENYSGPASPLWSLRSLVEAIYHPADAAIWTDRPEPLPVERGDFDVRVAGGRWRVLGQRASGTVTVEVLANSEGSRPSLEPFTFRQRLRSLARGEPGRPRNYEAKYDGRRYSSAEPLGS
jgi:hypothetical protein